MSMKIHIYPSYIMWNDVATKSISMKKKEEKKGLRINTRIYQLNVTQIINSKSTYQQIQRSVKKFNCILLRVDRTC